MFPTQTAQTLPFGPFFTQANFSRFDWFSIFEMLINFKKRYALTVSLPAVQISLSIIGDFSLKETAFVNQILDVRNVRRTIRVRIREGYKEENISEGFS